MKWTDAEDIGFALAEKYPHDDPLMVPLPDLRDRVLALDGFRDAAGASTEALLAAIRAAWHEEYQDGRR